MGMKAFLAQSAIKIENIKYVASKRFVDEETGQPEAWEIKAITPKEDEDLKKRCVRRVPHPDVRGQYITETDYDKYIGKLAAACTVYPNLNSEELQNSYGAMGADSVLKMMLTPGEYQDYCLKVQEICGYDVPQNALVDEAKN